MKNMIWYLGVVIIILAVATIILSKSNSRIISNNKMTNYEKTQINGILGVKIFGTIKSENLDCTIDGPTCSIYLEDGTEIIYAHGKRSTSGENTEPREIGTFTGPERSDSNIHTVSGMKIEAFAASLIPDDASPKGVYTLDGSREYYIRVIE